MKRTPWQEVVLRFAGDTSWRSTWDRAADRAVESAGGDAASFSEDVTEEHLGALDELYHGEGCVNWLASAQNSGRGLTREDIDWSGFAARRRKSPKLL